MPTKSGRIKLEDIRQGKTIWLAFRYSPDEPYRPKPFMVAAGPRLHFAGVLWKPGEAWGQAYCYPAYVLNPSFGWKDTRGERILSISFFHPARSSRIQSLPDGSHVYAKALISRRRCQRLCDELNRGGPQRYWFDPSNDTRKTVVLAPTEPAADASAVPGDA